MDSDLLHVSLILVHQLDVFLVIQHELFEVGEASAQFELDDDLAGRICSASSWASLS